MIKRNGGVIWHIERKNNPFAVNTGHESERGIDDRYIDWVIHNDGDMDHLRGEVAGAMTGFIDGSNSPESLKVFDPHCSELGPLTGSRLEFLRPSLSRYFCMPRIRSGEWNVRSQI